MNLFNTHDYQVSKLRINALQGVIFFLILGIVSRLFYLQVIEGDTYLVLGMQQRSIIRDISPERGRIFALASAGGGSDYYPLAVNKVYYEVSVYPFKITRPQNVTDIFAEVLGLDDEKKQQILDKVKKTDDQFELISKEVPKEKVDLLKEKFEQLRFDINKDRDEDEQIENLEELGINFYKNVLRYYPDKDIGAHILGFLGYGDDGFSRVGKYGLEAYFENELSGQGGQIVGEADVSGRLLSSNEGKAVENGYDVVLTIDRAVQYAACKALEKAVSKYDAKSGTVIIMETQTGAIKAMCDYPSFDPNDYSDIEDPEVYNNLAVYGSYEPGSVMKVIAMAIAIDQGKVEPDSTYKDEGEIKFSSGQVIRNAGNEKYGLIDMKEVLASSVNTGAVFATHEINNRIYEDYMKKFGFGQPSGLLISQDAKGDISSLAKEGDIFKATASYGQGITVTPIQMISAVNTIANRGKLVQPYIVSQIKSDDTVIEEFQPKVIRQVIDTATASKVSAMMVNVVDSGHATKAAVPGYYVAGKTGTAQVANTETGRYDDEKTIHNFVGFAPNDNPKFTMITKLDYPTAARYSADTAAPLFGEIAKFLLEYYQIPPKR